LIQCCAGDLIRGAFIRQKKIAMKILAALFSLMASAAIAQAPSSPALFMDDKFNSNLQERDMAISPDGKEMYYTLQSGQGIFSTILMRTLKSNGTWSEPSVASFSGMFSDLEPAFSHDGQKLFFCSNRPLSGDKKKDYDIWVMERNGSSWGAPKNLGPFINTSADEFYPSISTSGNLYFTAEYQGKGPGREDIYVSRWTDGNYQAPLPLDTMVNSKSYEFNAFVSPDEKFVLFTSYGRKDDTGGGDLYISEKDASGNWKKARNLKQLNSPRLDYCPYVSPDGKTLYFTSNRHSVQNAYSKPVTLVELQKTYRGALNGSDNVYWVSLVEGIK
jgi:Tol biopolymer transport system component